MSWFRNFLPSNSLPMEQEAEVGDMRNSLIARDSDVIEELDQHAEMQQQKRPTIMDEQSIVIYEQEQGSSSSSQLICHLDMVPSNSALSPKIESLKEKLGRLFARRSDVLTELEDAEFQPGQKRREEVRHWLTEVQKIKKKIQSMRNDGPGSSSNSNLSGSIETFIKEVDELIQRSKFPNGLVLLNQESTRLPLLRDIEPAGTNFRQNSEKILGWLRKHEHWIIGVYGMGGVGKTTLLMHIHDQLLQDSNLSGHVYWVTVSQNCPVHKLQKDIAKALGLKDIEEDDERKRASVLHNRITARGRTVLILDDMWEQVSGSKVGIPLENSDCKIILSTRLYDVCRKMGCKDFFIKAETLNKGEAWDLFVEKLGHYDTLEEEAKKIAWDIAKECGGLPLAIATMARTMTDVVDINEWKTAFNDLKSARNQADMEEDVFQILRYSYDRLNDKRVQQCFLNCVLYGEDAIIKRTDLIDLCLNEGLLDEIETRDAQVEKGHVMLNKLESCCLLEPSGDDCVKMHDLIRDMAIIITKEHPLFIAEAGKQLKKVPKEEKWSKDLVKVSFSHNHIEEIPSGMTPMTPNLTVLMLNENPLKKIPDSFFVHMKALTVLDLSGTGIERVPESVSDLENLRSLRLVECSKLKYVPSVAKLTKLRTLELEWCCNLNKAPRGLERLGNVEKVSYIPWDASDLIGFNEVMQSLPSLNLFPKILIWDPTSSKIRDEWEYFFDSHEKAVWIRGGKFGEDKSSWLLPTTLEYLRIEECDMKGRSLEVVFPSLSEATGMKEINIFFCDGLESISGSSGTQHGSSLLYTTQLEILMLAALSDLRSIAKLGAPHSFTRLRELDIRDCPDMKVVLPVTCSMELHLPELESIEVSECKELEEIFETNKATLSIPRIILPKLKCLELDSLPKMKVIFPFTEELQLPNLESIYVGECKEVEEIFGTNKAILSGPIPFLPNLKGLTLIDLPKIKVIFPFTEELHLPNLGRICVQGCEEVEEIFGTNEATLTSNSIFSLPGLEYLYLKDLPKIKVQLKQFNLSKLKIIELFNCGKIEEMFGLNKATLFNPLQALSSLEHLALCSLSKIKVIFPFTEQIHLQNLRTIRVSNCKEVEEIFESSKATPCNTILALPKLQSLKLEDLPNLRSIWNGMPIDIPKLRILDVRGCWKLEEARSRELERLKWVERVSYMPWDVSSDRIRFDKVMQSLASLSFYRILIGDGDPTFLCQSFNKWRGLYEKVVWIRGGEFGEDKSSFVLPTTVKCLGIDECDMKGRCLEDVFLSLHEAAGLKQIVLCKCRELDCVAGTKQGCWSSYPELDDLVLTGLPDLTSIAKFGPPVFFSGIRRLCISKCPKIKVVLPFRLHTLEIIEVKECDKVEEIFEANKTSPNNPPTLALPKLQSLKLEGLPNLRSIWNGMLIDTPELMILDVRGCWKLEEARSRELEKLKWVENVSHMPWDVSSDRIRFDKVMQSLTSLSFYRILIGDGDPTFLRQSFDKGRGFNMYEKVVWIKGGEFGEDKRRFLLPTTLKCLGIEECDMEGGCLGDVLPSLGVAKSLKQILLSKCRGLEYVIGSSGTQQGSLSSYFSNLNLDIIVLVGLPDLRSIANFGAAGSFSSIRRLCISECPKIKVVLPANFVKQVYFKNLEIIRVENCEEVDEIFEANEVAVYNQHVHLPSLKFLQLCSLPRLKVIFPSPSAMEVKKFEERKEISIVPRPTNFLHALTGLYLRSLPKIKVVFPFPEGRLLLPNLQSIEVEECYKLEEVFKSKKNYRFKPVLALPNLQSLKLKNLPNLHSISKGMLLDIPHLKLESIPIALQDRQNTGLTQSLYLPGVSNCPMLKLWLYPTGLVGDEPDRC